jgi:hypothetical protein
MGGGGNVFEKAANTMTLGGYDTLVKGKPIDESIVNATTFGMGGDAYAGLKKGVGDLFGGANKIGGFEMTPEARAAEQAILARQGAIASGEAPSPTAMQYQAALNQAAQAQMQQAASQRGVNPALAMRSAQEQIGQMTAGAAREQAILQEQERRRADEIMAQIAASQRGGALSQAQVNQQAQQAYENRNLGILSGLGGAGMQAAGGKK